MHIMTHKKRGSLFIDSELLDRARAYGLNLSRFMGNGLSIYFSSVEKGNSWKWGNAVCGGPSVYVITVETKIHIRIPVTHSWFS